MINSLKYFLISAYTFLAPILAFSQETIGDWDNNGRSDIAVAIVYKPSDASIPYIGTDWLVRRSNLSPLFFHFDVVADALVTGRYFSDQRIYPGVVRVVDLNSPLEWRIKNPQGEEVVVSYGLPGDRIVNQGDLDCDGITDFAVIREGRGAVSPFMFWYIALSGSGGKVVETLYGLKGDALFTADMNGDGCSELVALRPGTWQWFSRRLFGTKITQVQWGLPGDFPLVPQDINGDGKADYVITRVSGEKQAVFIRYTGITDADAIFDVSKDDLPILGKFFNNASKSFAFWNRSGQVLSFLRPDGSYSRDLFAIPTNILIRPDGTVIQPDQSGRFQSGDSSTPVGGDRAGCIASFGTDSDFIDGANGALWKPFSESNSAPAILLPSGYNGAAMTILANDGSVATSIERTRCCPNGDRAHWWLSRSKNANALAPLAPLTVKIEKDGITECRVVSDPRRRYD